MYQSKENMLHYLLLISIAIMLMPGTVECTLEAIQQPRNLQNKLPHYRLKSSTTGESDTHASRRLATCVELEPSKNDFLVYSFKVVFDVQKLINKTGYFVLEEKMIRENGGDEIEIGKLHSHCFTHTTASLCTYIVEFFDNVDITGNGDVVSGVIYAAGNIANDTGDCISSAITGGTGSFGGAIGTFNVDASPRNPDNYVYSINIFNSWDADF
mmetsp:Transcript_46185/g.46666  ORF Transcript_46185/g.46666 Transcript_46185/m.46666 type:complete len:213 (-) Transcript_46185:139-777(-)